MPVAKRSLWIFKTEPAALDTRFCVRDPHSEVGERRGPGVVVVGCTHNVTDRAEEAGLPRCTSHLNDQVGRRRGAVRVAERDGASGEIKLSGAASGDTEGSVIPAQQEPHQAHRDLRLPTTNCLRPPARG